MPIRVELLRNNRLTVFTYSDPFTVAELNEALATGMSISDSAKGRVYAIHDASQIRSLPRNLLGFASRTGKENVTHRIVGPVCVIAPSMFIHTIVNTIARVLPKDKLLVVNSMDEALAKIDALLANELNTEA